MANKWSNSEVVALIECYHNKSCLWDISDSSYVDADVRQAALQWIAEYFEHKFKTGQLIYVIIKN